MKVREYQEFLNGKFIDPEIAVDFISLKNIYTDEQIAKIDQELLLERLDVPILEQLGIVESKSFLKKLAKRNTQQNYTLPIYNLSREESAGYALLINLLHTRINTSIQELIINITLLTGAYKLDPSRVLDIIIDTFIANVEDYDFFLVLLKNFQNVDQILGFKFSFYASGTDTPVQLYWVAALLIKAQVVTLENLWNHILEDGNKSHEQYLTSIKTACLNAGRFEAPQMGGDLDFIVDKKETKTKIVLRSKEIKGADQRNQKAGICNALLGLGHLDNALKILRCDSQFINLSPELATNFCRLIHVIIEEIDHGCQLISNINKASPNSDLFVSSIITLNTHISPIDEKVTNGKKLYPPIFTFFCKDWKNNLIKAQSFHDVVVILRNYLPIVGTHLSVDILLLGKIIRIGHNHLKSNPSLENKNEWINIISLYIFPAFSNIESNPGLSHALWELVKTFPYTVRYALYGEWKNAYEQPEMMVCEAACRKDMGYILNRLSKDNVKIFGRYIAKIVHSNPIIAFSLILNTIEGYDNMIPFIIEATRYLTCLDLDILSYSIIESLCSSKSKIEKNGTTIEKWLKSLSEFCGLLYKKHDIELDGLLSYITNQLLSGKLYDLVVLHDLVSSMAGILVSEDCSAIQIENMQGGLVLRKSAHNQDRNVQKSTERIITSLRKTNLATVIMTILAQQRQVIIAKMNSDCIVAPDVKVIGWTFDLVHKSLLLFIEFLGDFGQEILFDFEVLVQDFGIDVGVAFAISRSTSSSDAKKVNQEELASKNDDRMDVDEPFIKDSVLFAGTIGIVQDHCQCVSLSAEFWVTFWTLTLGDINVPTLRYQNAMDKVENRVVELKSNQSSRGVTKRLKEIKSAIKLKKLLLHEFENRSQRSQHILSRLLETKNDWFIGHSLDITGSLLQNCVYPRCVFSPIDAIFCAKFTFLIHSIEAPNFSLIQYLNIVIVIDKIWNRDGLQSFLYCLTGVEARNYGIFLNCIMDKLTLWRTDSVMFQLEAKLSSTPRAYLLDHKQYKTSMLGWHSRLLGCFLLCLESLDYIQIRNAMLILNSMIIVFPIIDHMAISIENSIQKIEQKETRGDIKQMARSYYALLIRRKSLRCTDNEFLGEARIDNSKSVRLISDISNKDYIAQESRNDIKVYNNNNDGVDNSHLKPDYENEASTFRRLSLGEIECTDIIIDPATGNNAESIRDDTVKEEINRKDRADSHTVMNSQKTERNSYTQEKLPEKRKVASSNNTPVLRMKTDDFSIDFAGDIYPDQSVYRLKKEIDQQRSKSWEQDWINTKKEHHQANNFEKTADVFLQSSNIEMGADKSSTVGKSSTAKKLDISTTQSSELELGELQAGINIKKVSPVVTDKVPIDLKTRLVLEQQSIPQDVKDLKEKLYKHQIQRQVQERKQILVLSNPAIVEPVIYIDSSEAARKTSTNIALQKALKSIGQASQVVVPIAEGKIFNPNQSDAPTPPSPNRKPISQENSQILIEPPSNSGALIPDHILPAPNPSPSISKIPLSSSRSEATQPNDIKNTRSEDKREHDYKIESHSRSGERNSRGNTDSHNLKGESRRDSDRSGSSNRESKHSDRRYDRQSYDRKDDKKDSDRSDSRYDKGYGRVVKFNENDDRSKRSRQDNDDSNKYKQRRNDVK